MDPIAMIFYAAVCGCLSVFAPKLGGTAPRLMVGAIVGIVAAAVLPLLPVSRRDAPDVLGDAQELEPPLAGL